MADAKWEEPKVVYVLVRELCASYGDVAAKCSASVVGVFSTEELAARGTRKDMRFVRGLWRGRKPERVVRGAFPQLCYRCDSGTLNEYRWDVRPHVVDAI